MKTTSRAKIETVLRDNGISKEELRTILQDAGDPWVQAMGLLKGRRVDPVRYQKKLRRELSR